MKFKTSPPKKTFKSLRVDPETYAQLRTEDANHYFFDISFKMSRSTDLLNSKVVVTIKEKTTQNSQLVSTASKFQSESSDLEDNLKTTQKSTFENLKFSKQNFVKNNIDDMPPKLKKKFTSGIQSQIDFEKKEEYVDRVEVVIPDNSILQSVIYSYTEMVVLPTKPKKASMHGATLTASETLNVDPKDPIERINFEKLSPTMCAQEGLTLGYDSNWKLSDFKNKGNLKTDYARYFISNVSNSPDEKNYPYYSTQITTGARDFIELKCTVQISKKSSQNLETRFDVVDEVSGIVEESTKLNLPISRHVEAFRCITKPPVVTYQKIGRKYRVMVQDIETKGKIKSFNFYLKQFDKFGTSTGYKLLGQIKNSGNSHLDLMISQQLAVVRVIPVDHIGKESTAHSDVIVGAGHDTIGAFTIVVDTESSGTRIEAYNVPKGTGKLILFKRVCENPDSSFSIEQISYIQDEGVSKNRSTFIDKAVLSGKVYEYCVVAIKNSLQHSLMQKVSLTPEMTISKELANEHESNMVMLKYVPVASTKNSVNVTITNPTANFQETDKVVSFTITTSISGKENETITESIKTQIAEFYGQYLNPFSNKNSPLGNGAEGYPSYKDLIMHEVVRTNLNTGTRESFPLTTDGVFIDSNQTRKFTSISAINPLHEYVYQVITYKRNPIELFKKYVATGINKKGKQWFYSPYKWKNSSARTGMLYPEDSQGQTIIDEYSTFTSESYGVTALHRVYGAGQYTALSQVEATRIDIDTIKVAWSTTGNSSLYDSFVVMKVVNGIRSFVGNTCKNYIYHELTKDDIGDVYYIVVPFMADMDLDDPGYSNHVLISPDGITPVVPGGNHNG